jgi:4a-hydroxytetrahydrobiopterin dehydratase
MPFWRAVLGYRRSATKTFSTLTPRVLRSGSRRWTRRARSAIGSTSTSGWRTTRAEARVAAAIAAGCHLVSDEFAPAWWTLADAEGNEVDVATWMGRD